MCALGSVHAHVTLARRLTEAFTTGEFHKCSGDAACSSDYCYNGSCASNFGAIVDLDDGESTTTTRRIFMLADRLNRRALQGRIKLQEHVRHVLGRLHERRRRRRWWWRAHATIMQR